MVVVAAAAAAARIRIEVVVGMMDTVYDSVHDLGFLRCKQE